METKDFILIGFGTFLGLISTVVGSILLDSIKTGTKRDLILKGIYNELLAIKYHYTLVTTNIYIRYGLLNIEKLTWTYNNLKDFKADKQAKDVIDKLEPLRNRTDEDIKNSSIIRMEQVRLAQTVLNFKKYRLAFTEYNLGFLELLDAETQQKIINIIKQLDFLNQEVEYTWTFFLKTFEIEDAENHSKIVSNYDTSAQGIARWGSKLVDDITELLTQINNRNPQPSNMKCMGII